MTAQPHTHPAPAPWSDSAPAWPRQIDYVPLIEPLLDQVVALEQRAHRHPWTRGNFVDSMRNHHEIRVLIMDSLVQGYSVTMPGHGEGHLLNITVAPAFQGFGFGRILLGYATLYALGRGESCMLLEVRASNTAAIRLYESHGFKRIGRRKNYYAGENAQREDALVYKMWLL